MSSILVPQRDIEVLSGSHLWESRLYLKLYPSETFQHLVMFISEESFFIYFFIVKYSLIRYKKPHAVVSEGTQVPVHCLDHAAVGGLFHFSSCAIYYNHHSRRNRFRVRKHTSFLLFLLPPYLFPSYFPILSMDR